MPLDEHDFDDDGLHLAESCELCLEQNGAVQSECRCGNCCERLILESSVRDAEREPRIAEECQPLRDIGPDVVGYLLNDREQGMACHFFDREKRVCTIYETRPLMCRLFDCDVERRCGDCAELLCHEAGSSDCTEQLHSPSTEKTSGDVEAENSQGSRHGLS